MVHSALDLIQKGTGKANLERELIWKGEKPNLEQEIGAILDLVKSEKGENLDLDTLTKKGKSELPVNVRSNGGWRNLIWVWLEYIFGYWQIMLKTRAI